MMKHALATAMLLVTAAITAGAGLSGCGGPEVPASPTWTDDIRPLMVARCIRCHDDPRRVDPSTSSAMVPPSNFNLENGTDPALASLKLLGAKLARAPYLNFRRMPPPPAEALEDWQIEMLEIWAANPR